MDDELTTTTVAEPGVATEASQQTGVAQPEGSTASEVEAGKETSQKTEETRRKPYDYYKEREIARTRKRIESIEEKIDRIGKYLESPKTVSSGQKPKFDLERFSADPGGVMSQYIKDEIAGFRSELLEKELPTIINERESRTHQELKLERTLDVIFPRTGENDRRNLRDRIFANPDRYEVIGQIIEDYNLNEFSKVNPEATGEIILMIEKEKYGGGKPGTHKIGKNLVGSTATGSQVSGGAGKSSFENIKKKLDAINDEADRKPELRFSKEWRGKKAELIKQLESFVSSENKEE